MTQKPTKKSPKTANNQANNLTKKPKSPKKSPKRRQKSGFKNHLGFMVVGFLLGILGGVIYTTIFAKTTKPAQSLVIKKGDTYQKVFKDWHDGAFYSNAVNKLYLKINANKPLQAGTYQISQGASVRQALQILQQGAESAMIGVQIIEGKTIKDLYYTLKNTQGVVLETLSEGTGDYTWQKVADDNKKVGKSLGVDYKTLEGLFAPDTYYFNYGTTDTKILKKLYQTQLSNLDTAWQNRADNLPYKNKYELLIMASIIEKETGLTDERPQVSSVFVNRLNQGMRLQTDPTIIYGLFDRYDGKIYKSNIQEKTEYNTYQIDGLPPTPIALPSKEAILAAAHPDNTPYLYFVATGVGGHTFTTNLADHERAVAKYRQTIAKK